jgi:hypothetical protein
VQDSRSGPFPISRAIAAAAMLAALCACENPERDEIDVESEMILARVPAGTSFDDLPAAMQALGFACTPGRKRFISNGRVRDAEPHLECTREETYWLACRRRTRAILLQLNGRLSNILVNVGRFCG